MKKSRPLPGGLQGWAVEAGGSVQEEAPEINVVDFCMEGRSREKTVGKRTQNKNAGGTKCLDSGKGGDVRKPEKRRRQTGGHGPRQ